ncbi:MAG: tryptophan-rich sensory protein [Spirochaetaceae bacterium]|nr:tryptophan-rich sensory protein [Spirochaetaceae bacterium]
MSRLKNHLLLVVLNGISFIAILVFNSLASIIPLGGLNTGELSDLYPNLFVPAGLTFSIWGIIYILLAIYVVYSFIFIFRESENHYSFVDKVGLLFFFSSLANICWILSWHYRQVALSVVCMFILLISLLFIYQGLKIGNAHVSRKERLLIHLPFSVYTGWITVATIANITALLVHVNWKGFGLSESFWTIFLVIVATLFGLFFLFFRKDIAYAAVIDWALLGIYLKRTALRNSEPAEALITTVLIALIVLTSAIIIEPGIRAFKKKRIVL